VPLLDPRCNSKEKAVHPPKAGAGPPPEVTVVELTSQTVSIYRDFVAQTYSVDMVEIRARVEGFIEEKLFTAAQNVKHRRRCSSPRGPSRNSKACSRS
jgi:multidrug efflux pump subunit AcrA (membrane-fusion protein)